MTPHRVVVGSAAQADKALAELNARHKAAQDYPQASSLLLYASSAKLAKLTPAELREAGISASVIKSILEAK